MDKSLALSTFESVVRRVIFLAGMYPKGSLEMRTPFSSIPERNSSEIIKEFDSIYANYNKSGHDYHYQIGI